MNHVPGAKSNSESRTWGKIEPKRTEINLKRLLTAAPRQQNQAKLVHVRPLTIGNNFLLIPVSNFIYRNHVICGFGHLDNAN